MLLRTIKTLLWGVMPLCFGGGSSSAQTTSTNTTNMDKRVAIQGGIAVTGDPGGVTVNSTSLDGGAIAASMNIAQQSLDGMTFLNAINADGFNNLLNLSASAGASNAESFNNLLGASASSESAGLQRFDALLGASSSSESAGLQRFDALMGTAGDLFKSAGELYTKSQDTALAQIAAIGTAKNDATGAVDQKTMMMLGLGAVAMVGLLSRRKG